MDSLTRWQIKATLTFLVGAFILIVGAGVLYLVFVINPIYTDSASVPSKTTDMAGPYAAAAENSRRLIRTLVVNDNAPAFSIAVAVDGKTVWAEAFGYADVEGRVQATPGTRFHLGSVSKTLTAAAVALLHDRGRLDLDAPVQKYVPSYPQKAWTVTPRHLLGDVGGVHIIRGDNNDQPPFGHCSDLKQAVQKFSAEPLLFQPGTAYRFASNGWVLLSAVIEGAAAEPFDAFMSREVFGPLGMTRTIRQGTTPDPDLVSVFEPAAIMLHKLGMEADSGPGADYSCFFGSGAFLSTPSDLVRLGSAMLKPGFLKKETIAVFGEPLQLPSGASTGFALGWKADTIQFAGAQERVLRHRAIPYGAAVSLMLVPQHNLAIAAIAYGSSIDRVDPLTVQVAETFAPTR